MIATYTDPDGYVHTLEGPSVEAVAAQLPPCFVARTALVVVDDAGFIRGWIRSRKEWRAQ